MEVKEQIKRRVSIVEVASLYVDLKPAGKYFKALCPFHTEKTPSFFIMPEKDTFTCYGCNKFGDVFTLVQEIENIGFPDAINLLIEKFNLPIEYKKGVTVDKKDLYVKTNELALTYFKTVLKDTQEGGKALDYLKKRGIENSSIEHFGLGYAENKWDGLISFFKNESCDINKAIELGLLIKNEKGHIYDRFRGRIIFPIFSESGTVLAFGGRTLFDDSNKYLNSPDSLIYKKSKHLYGFNKAKKFIRENKSLIIVEGYFDMVSLFQRGIKNVVANLGTALTEDQFYMLKRYSPSDIGFYLFYDSDEAGISAAKRGIEKMFEHNINPKIIRTGDSNDPDDFIRKKGPNAFKKLVDSAIDGFKFLLKEVDSQFNTNIPEKKRGAVEEIKKYLEKFKDPIIRDGYSEQAASFFRVNVSEFKPESENNLMDGHSSQALLLSPAEKNFIESIFVMPELIDGVKDLFNENLLAVLASKNIVRAIFKNYNIKTKEIEYEKVSNGLTESEKGVIRGVFETKDKIRENRDVLEKRIESSFLNFQNKLNNREIMSINQQIKVAERENNVEEVKKLMILKNKYIKSRYKNIGGPVAE